jgi:hypothetical protein
MLQIYYKTGAVSITGPLIYRKTKYLCHNSMSCHTLKITMKTDTETQNKPDNAFA